MRTLLARILVVACLTFAALAPGLAAAQSNPFDGLPPAAPDTSTTDTTATTTGTGTGGGGLKRWQELLIFAAGVALIGGIGVAIVRDAHKTAPVTEDERAGAHRSSAAGARKAHDRAKSRKKAKAVRAARRHNR